MMTVISKHANSPEKSVRLRELNVTLNVTTSSNSDVKSHSFNLRG